MISNIVRNTTSILAVVAIVATVAVYRLRAPTQFEIAPAAPNDARPGAAPRMVDLGADKCIPCKKMAPILAELKTEYAGRAVIEFIDVWKNPSAGEPYDVRIIPTQIFFDRDGKEVWRHEGFLPKDEIVAKLKTLGVS